MRVGSWNIRFGRADDGLLDDHDLDLLCLQECTPEAFGRFAARFAWGFHAMDPSWLGDVQVERRHGVAVLGSTTATPDLWPPARELLAPEKLMAVDLALPGGRPLTVASYHAYAGRKGTDELDKPRLTGQVASWLAKQPGPMILAMDANSPWVDHPDPDQVECCFAQPASRYMERALLHPTDRTHRLRDVLRTHLDTHPDELAAIRAERPEGPLAVSHRTGHTRTRPGTARRYDHILATPEIGVTCVRYLYDEAIAAGSDHALVLAEIDVGREHQT